MRVRVGLRVRRELVEPMGSRAGNILRMRGLGGEGRDGLLLLGMWLRDSDGDHHRLIDRLLHHPARSWSRRHHHRDTLLPGRLGLGIRRRGRRLILLLLDMLRWLGLLRVGLTVRLLEHGRRGLDVRDHEVVARMLLKRRLAVLSAGVSLALGKAGRRGHGGLTKYCLGNGMNWVDRDRRGLAHPSFCFLPCLLVSYNLTRDE